jgi:hypothetical protein
MAMIRKQIYVGRQHDKLLKQFVKKLGVTEAEVVRRAIALFASNTEDVLPSKTMAGASQRAWQDFLKGIQLTHSTPADTDASVRWSRAELYDERDAELERRRQKHTL